MITLAISHKPRVTEKTVLSGDPFFQLQAVALALLRVVRLAAGFLVRLGVVVGAAEAGCMGAGAGPSGAVAGAKKNSPYLSGALAPLYKPLFSWILNTLRKYTALSQREL